MKFYNEANFIYNTTKENDNLKTTAILLQILDFINHIVDILNQYEDNNHFIEQLKSQIEEKGL